MVSGVGSSHVQTAVTSCLEEGGFGTRVRYTSQTTAFIVGTQRAPWYRVLASALPQRFTFEIRVDPIDDRVHLKYDDQLAPWYLAVLVAIAATMTPYWLESLAMLFRVLSATAQLPEFRPLQVWASGVAGLVFVRMMQASGAGTTTALLEEIRSRLRHLGANIDQRQTGTITTKLLLSLLFTLHLVAVMVLGVLAGWGVGITVSSTNALTAGAAIALVVVIGFAIARGTQRTIRPIGGEERFAMVATGISIQLGVLLLLLVQAQFLLLGQTTDEIWAMVFRTARFLAMDDGQVRAAGLGHLSRDRLEAGFSMVGTFGHMFFMPVAAFGCVGAILIIRSIRLAPSIRRICERVHEDIESDYGRAAASGKVFRQRSRRPFLLAWGLLGAVIAVGLFSLAQLGIASFQFRYAGRTPETAMGAVDATANLINLLAGTEEHSYVGPCISRVFYSCWAAVMILPVIFSLRHGWVTARRRGRHLIALSESLPSAAAELNGELKQMAASVGMDIRLAISPGLQPTAAAHRVGLLGSRKLVEVSQRCLELLNAAERKALVGHELGHHLCGHCWKHNAMQWLGRLTCVGGTFVTSMEDSYGFEMQADKAAVERLGVDPASLRTCLMKMRADAIVQRLRWGTEGLGILGTAASSEPLGCVRTIGFPGWRVAFRDWYALFRADTQIAYWHPSVADRIRALAEDDGQQQVQ